MTPAKILIIDDDAFTRQLYGQVFKQEGYEPLEADKGERGLLLALKERPALILLDLQMPQMDGIQVLSKIRAESSLNDVLILILSARGQKEDVEKGLRNGADDYAIKGYDRPKQVLEKVQALLSKGRMTPTYRIVPQANRADALRLQKDFQLGEGLSCPSCRSGVELDLSLTPNTGGPFCFQTRIVCPECQKSIGRK